MKLRKVVGSLDGMNVGFALCTKGEAPGTLDATWTYENTWGGPGHATGGPDLACRTGHSPFRAAVVSAEPTEGSPPWPHPSSL